MAVSEFLADRTRRNVAILALAQVLFHSTQGMAIATTPLAALQMLGDNKTWATVPIFLAHVGLMTTTLPAALLMGRVGRRAGFTLGAMIGIVGGLVSFAAVWVQSFALLCLGGFLQGAAASFAWHYRFAATDTASDDYKAKALSLVMVGGVLAGLIGPQTAKWAVGIFDPVLFAGVYMMASVFAVGMLLLVQLVRIPNPVRTEGASSGRPMSEIMRQPMFVVAVLSSMFGYAVMTLVMSATPLAMNGCGFGFADSATVIQAHVIAMFLPSFFTGHLINRFGVLPIIAAGAAIEMLCAVVNFMGIGFFNFLIANMLVGLGWNFCYVGGSTLLTKSYRTEEKAKVQGTHDFLVYGTTAMAAALSGTLQAQAGWTVTNAASLPMLAIVLGAVFWLSRMQKTAAAARQHEA
ncbi:MAG: MFS transporter [Hyphomicrobiaceae bacterium]|nr:MFS transporter [Hyphomicrobiaceae bacterium]